MRLAKRAATIVLGQTNFTSSGYNMTSSTLSFPSGLAADSFGNIWVSDSSNERVLEFQKGSGFTNGQAASAVLGQTDFAANAYTVSSTGLNDPSGIAVDGRGDVWVADFQANRVLEFKAPTSTGESASVVLGQGDSPRTPLPPAQRV